MEAPTLTIKKKKYRVIPETEYLKLKEDLEDMAIMLNRKSEKGIEARAFFAKINKKKK